MVKGDFLPKWLSQNEKITTKDNLMAKLSNQFSLGREGGWGGGGGEENNTTRTVKQRAKEIASLDTTIWPKPRRRRWEIAENGAEVWNLDSG